MYKKKQGRWFYFTSGTTKYELIIAWLVLNCWARSSVQLRTIDIGSLNHKGPIQFDGFSWENTKVEFDALGVNQLKQRDPHKKTKMNPHFSFPI